MNRAHQEHQETMPEQTAEQQRAIIQFLCTPAAYGEPDDASVQVIETHLASVFLVGDKAYKLKRAVKFPFADFTTLEARRQTCVNELQINRRFCPELYIGVAPISRDGGGKIHIGSIRDGEIVDWLVIMHRFDQDQLMENVMGRGEFDDDLAAECGRMVANHHTGAPAAKSDGWGDRLVDIIQRNAWELMNYRDVFRRRTVSAIGAHTEMLARSQLAQMRDREVDGKVRHCHGDLHLQNMILADNEPKAFDALEFDDSLAEVDLFYDLAFLLMDLIYRGGGRQANRVLNAYLEETQDYVGLVQLPLFIATRAVIRAKVCAAQGKADQARAYFDLAAQLPRSQPPRLIVIGGLSGTGKSTLARQIAHQIGDAPGAVHFRSDQIRKQLYGQPETTTLPPDAYEPRVSTAVYQTMANRADAVLAAGRSVILDAVFARPEERAAVEALAKRRNVAFSGIWLQAAPDVMVTRVKNRVNDASDATPDVVRSQLSYDIGPITWDQFPSDREDAAGMLATRVLATVNRSPAE